MDSPHLVRVYDAVLAAGFALACEYLPLGALADPTHPVSRPEILAAVRHAALAAAVTGTRCLHVEPGA